MVEIWLGRSEATPQLVLSEKNMVLIREMLTDGDLEVIKQ